jgi:hypothetical protein
MTMAGTKTLSLLLPIAALAVACFPEARLVESFDDVLGAEGLDSLHAVVGAGDLRVEGEEGLDHIAVEVRIYTQLAPCDEDAEVLDDMDYDLYANDEGEARLWVDMDADWQSYWADVTIRMPAAMALDLRDGSGDIDISDVAALVMDDESGDADIEGIAGDVEIEDGSGDLTIIHVGGRLTVDDASGDIDIRDQAGSVDIVDGSGDLWLEEAFADVRIDDEGGDMDLRKIDGDVEIEDGSGDIDVRQVTGVVTIHDDGGDIHAQDVGDLEVVEDSSGEVDWD